MQEITHINTILLYPDNQRFIRNESAALENKPEIIAHLSRQLQPTPANLLEKVVITLTWSIAPVLLIGIGSIPARLLVGHILSPAGTKQIGVVEIFLVLAFLSQVVLGIRLLNIVITIWLHGYIAKYQYRRMMLFGRMTVGRLVSIEKQNGLTELRYCFQFSKTQTITDGYRTASTINVEVDAPVTVLYLSKQSHILL